MKARLTEYVQHYGVAGVLEILMVVCDDKAKATEDEVLKKKYNKAATKIYQLSIAKFIKPL